MSWSIQAIGKPDAVKRAIETANIGLTGQSKDEWEEAKPALLALVGANCGNVVVRLNASGHVSFELRPVERDSEGMPTKTERIKTHGQCSVTIEPIHGFVE